MDCLSWVFLWTKMSSTPMHWQSKFKPDQPILRLDSEALCSSHPHHLGAVGNNHNSSWPTTECLGMWLLWQLSSVGVSSGIRLTCSIQTSSMPADLAWSTSHRIGVLKIVPKTKFRRYCFTHHHSSSIASLHSTLMHVIGFPIGFPILYLGIPATNRGLD